MKMVYDLKGEVDHWRLKMEGYSEPCNCTRLENLINDNAEKISRNTQNIENLNLEINDVQDEIQDLASVVDNNSEGIIANAERITKNEGIGARNLEMIKTLDSNVSDNTQRIEENSEMVGKIGDFDQRIENNKANITENADVLAILKNEITQVGDVLETNTNQIEENTENIQTIVINVVGLTSRIFQLENPTKVAFSALRTPNLDLVVGEGDVTFDKMELNVGNAFDPTNGIFKVPLAGSYYLTITAPCLSCIVGLVKNGEVYLYTSQGWFGGYSPVQDLVHQDEDNQFWVSNLDYSLAMDLKEGDEIKIRLFGGTLMVSGDSDWRPMAINFSGFLI